MWTDRAQAIAYLRTDISGVHQKWDETQMRGLAKRLGFNLCKTIAFSHTTRDPIGKLLEVVEHQRVDTVFVPHVGHLGDDLDRVAARIEVIVNAEETYGPPPALRVVFTDDGPSPDSGP
ncbi:hypothetical protein [Nocardia brevicatena]|uniref:hypothetical protein n=1 Tax=Nocardia brevicatena TaxID=37327 RepID=UPI0002D47555|nr:hypothetical protein [Nocardia brevicatena]